MFFCFFALLRNTSSLHKVKLTTDYRNDQPPEYKRRAQGSRLLRMKGAKNNTTTTKTTPGF